MYAERNGIFQKAILVLRDAVKNGYRFDEPACVETERLAYKIKIENSPNIEFFTTMMEERKGDVSKEDISRVDSIFAIYKVWYKAQNYNINFMRSKKAFFKDIADFVGVAYEKMNMRK